jgi:catechol 2,3-dioxygenase-like lactoylglutathione lyase family enzyme
MKLVGLNRIEVLVRDPDRAERDFSSLLGGLAFRPESAGDHPLDCRIDWRAGIEIVHPEAEDHPVAALLREHGEHVFTVVFEVEDLDEAKAWVREQGFEIQYEFSPEPTGAVEVMRQITLGPERTHGVVVTLMERRLRAEA